MRTKYKYRDTSHKSHEYKYIERNNAVKKKRGLRDVQNDHIRRMLPLKVASERRFLGRDKYAER